MGETVHLKKYHEHGSEGKVIQLSWDNSATVRVQFAVPPIGAEERERQQNELKILQEEHDQTVRWHDQLVQRQQPTPQRFVYTSYRTNNVRPPTRLERHQEEEQKKQREQLLKLQASFLED